MCSLRIITFLIMYEWPNKSEYCIKHSKYKIIPWCRRDFMHQYGSGKIGYVESIEMFHIVEVHPKWWKLDNCHDNWNSFNIFYGMDIKRYPPQLKHWYIYINNTVLIYISFIQKHLMHASRNSIIFYLYVFNGIVLITIGSRI